MKALIGIIFLSAVYLGHSQSVSDNEENLNHVKLTADSLLTEFFGTKHMTNSIRWNKSKSFVNCQTSSGIQIYKFTDKFEGQITVYDLTYEIYIGSEMIFDFRVDCKPNYNCSLWTGAFWKGKFNAYKKLLNGELIVDYKKAISIGVKNGISKEFISAELFHKTGGNIENLSEYYWIIFDTRDPETSRTIYQINASSGEVTQSKEVRISVH